MKWKKFILEIGPGADNYFIKRAQRDPEALVVALELKSVKKKYPENVAFAEPMDKFVGIALKDKDRGIDLTISERMFDEAHIHQVILSPEFDEHIKGDYERGIPRLIKAVCEVMKDDGIIVITDGFHALLVGEKEYLVKTSLKNCGFRYHEINDEDVHSDWGKRYKRTNRCIYASKKHIDESSIEELKKY